MLTFILTSNISREATTRTGNIFVEAMRHLVEMLTKNIPLEQAVLDLVDNSIDGAKRMDPSTFEGRQVAITLNENAFRILDNCGGFGKATAKDYAFRFGRPPNTPHPNSVGQFGVGMKRALFKFGNRFAVRSATPEEKWAIDVDVRRWVAHADDWRFAWSKLRKRSADLPRPAWHRDRCRQAPRGSCHSLWHTAIRKPNRRFDSV
jgi:hypothetical protein